MPLSLPTSYHNACEDGHLSSRRDALEGQVQQISARRDSLKLELKQAKSPSVHALLDMANTAKADKISRLRCLEWVAHGDHRRSEAWSAFLTAPRQQRPLHRRQFPLIEAGAVLVVAENDRLPLPFRLAGKDRLQMRGQAVHFREFGEVVDEGLQFARLASIGVFTCLHSLHQRADISFLLGFG